MCELLGVSRSSYYEWCHNKNPQGGKTQQLSERIKQLFEQSKRTYGSPRIHRVLEDEGVQVSKATVGRIMRSLGLQARPRRKYIHTTDSTHQYKVFENVLNRMFSSNRVNEKWVSDITYIATKEGWTFLTVIMDLADRMVVSWTLSQSMDAHSTTVNALKIALQRRKVEQALLFHSDRGSQYCCAEFRIELGKIKDIQQSMSRKGNCWDNAVIESFFKTLKCEWTNKFNYKNIDQARSSIFDYIERWYNTQRKHSSLNYLTPLQKFHLLNNRTAA